MDFPEGSNIGAPGGFSFPLEPFLLMLSFSEILNQTRSTIKKEERQ